MRHVLPTVDSLESRRLLAAVEPTAFEQYMIEMINRARANPVAEAQRYGIDLNEGLSPGTLSSAASQPLAPNLFATDAARTHVDWLRTAGEFSHTGSGGSNPGQRLAAAGYTNSTSWAENIAVNMSSSSSVDLQALMETQHRNLFLSSGHRRNMLGGGNREIGSGVSSGPYTSNGTNWASGVLSAQKFAFRPGSPFLTGVAYTDAVQANNLYTPGEGLAGITISAVSSTGQTYSTTTYTAGGYSLQLPAGTYQVSASGNGLGVIRIGAVTLGSQNIKRDFTPSMAQAGQPEPLVVSGTTGHDTINITVSVNELVMTVNGTTTRRALELVESLTVNGLEGNDTITLGEDVIRTTVNGGAGNDSIVGPNAASRLNGDAGNDSILGGTDNDTLSGGEGRDYIFGDAGRDLIYGGPGHDTLSGGAQNDTIYGGTGEDRINGNGGHDQLFGEEDFDRIYGGAGNDFADLGSGRNRAWGEEGDDTLIGGNSADRMWGGPGNDILYGRGGVDGLYGGDGDDTLIGGAGFDFFIGGAGTNTADFDEDEDDFAESIQILLR